MTHNEDTRIVAIQIYHNLMLRKTLKPKAKPEVTKTENGTCHSMELTDGKRQIIVEIYEVD